MRPNRGPNNQIHIRDGKLVSDGNSSECEFRDGLGRINFDGNMSSV